MYRENIWSNDVLINGLDGVFSPNRIDRGTKLMLENISISNEDKVLDLGCGTGVVGISIAKKIGISNVVMVDIDSKAVECSRRNLELNNLSDIKLIRSNGFEMIEDTDFTLILSNPPYHADFSVAKNFIEHGKKHLIKSGKMVLVVKRLNWYKNKMTSIFGGVKVLETDGYYILTSEKRDVKNKVRDKNRPIKKKHLKKVLASKKRTQNKR